MYTQNHTSSEIIAMLEKRKMNVDDIAFEYILETVYRITNKRTFHSDVYGYHILHV
mgnify:CR=1 FL=1